MDIEDPECVLPKFVPNVLSGLRIILAPFICWWVVEKAWTPALWWSLVAIISDFLDGYLARLMDSKSWLGSKLDPLADKILLGSVFITLGVQGLIPFYLVILVISRDLCIIIFAFFSFLKHPSLVLKPKLLSKINTGLQFFLVLFLLMHEAWGVLGEVISSLIVLTGLTTVGSWGEYIKKYYFPSNVL